MADYIKTFIGSGTKYWKLTPNNGTYVYGSTSFSDGRTLVFGASSPRDGFEVEGNVNSYLWIGSDGNQKYEWLGLPSTTGTVLTYDAGVAPDDSVVAYGKFKSSLTGHYLPTASKFTSGYIDSWSKVQQDDTGTYTTSYDDEQKQRNLIAVDSSGNSYIVIFQGGTRLVSRETGIAKFNSSGTLQWVKHFYAGSVDDDDFEIQSIACQSDDSLVIAGIGTGIRLCLININGSGNIVWSRYNLGGNSTGIDPVSIKIDSSDNIIILGNLADGSGLPEVVKCSSTGTVQWTRQASYIGSDTYPPEFNLPQIAVDASDNIYYSGNDSTGPGAPSENLTYHIVKINSSGTLQWVRRLADKEKSTGDGNLTDYPHLSVNDYDNAYAFTSLHSVFKMPLDGTRTGDYSTLAYTDDTTSWTLSTSTVGSGVSSSTFFTVATDPIEFENFGIQERGRVNWTADFRVIAAPGFIKLGAANLYSQSSGGRESGTYNEPGYFTPEDYCETIEVTTGTFNATLTLGGITALSADSQVTATAISNIGAGSDLQSQADISLVTGVIYQPTANIASDSQTAIVTDLFKSTTISAEVNSTLTCQAGVIRQGLSEWSSEFDHNAQGNAIYDIGIAYAIDWVIPEDEYVLPLQFLRLLVDSAIYAAASVEVVPFANLFAESDIVGTGGYFDAGAQMIAGANAEFNIQPVVSGGAGLIFNQLTELAVDVTQSAQAGKLQSIQAEIAAEFEMFTSGGRYQLIATDILAEFNIIIDETLFKQSPLFNFRVDTALETQPGKYWSAQTDLQSTFTVPEIRSRIISIDEYYIDKVVRERRTVTVFEELTQALVAQEARTIAVFEEARINQVDHEQRQLRPAVGRPTQVGSRIRRITA